MLGFEAPDTGEIDVPDDIKRVEYFLNKSTNPIHQRLIKSIIILPKKKKMKHRVCHIW